jgi:hypothetical protein
VLEFASGGDLYDKLQLARTFGVADTRVYIAHVLLALEPGQQLKVGGTRVCTIDEGPTGPLQPAF